ncbi:MAG: AarF/UbiB family protein [Victivallaceae bacterium]|nr:AarF/UbiB family protein [Victivallaceae bacterium]
MKTPFEINHDYRTLKRFWKILGTAAAFGFNEFTDHAFPQRRLHRVKARDITGKSRPEKLRMAMEELGPTFVKLGQILSTRTDLISPVYAAELAKLTDKVAPFPLADARRIIQEELGGEPEKIFRDFSRKPVGAASIGQVHTATLADGSEVVVKIRRPGVDETIGLDLDIMRYIARAAEAYDDKLAKFHPVRVVDEFAYSLRRELDYRCEAANMLRFTKNMTNSEGLTVPKLYLELSTAKVLVMERIVGDPASKVIADPSTAAKYNLKSIAEKGVNSLLSQIFEYGFFHGDPHPGNIFLMDKDRFAFIDFGMMGRVSESERQDFVRIIDHMLAGRIPLMCDAALRMTISGRIVGRRDNFERDVADLVDENINLPLEKLSVGKVLQKLMDILNTYELALKPNLYMMCKAVMTIESLGRRFDPQLKIVELVKPFVMKMKIRSFDPKPVAMRLLDSLGDNIAALESLPTSLRNIFHMYEQGKLTLRVEHHRLDNVEETLYITGERVSRALLVTALIVGSALLVVAKVPPLWAGVPLVGMIGFLFAGMLSLLIMLDDHIQRRKFIRNRRKRRFENDDDDDN